MTPWVGVAALSCAAGGLAGTFASWSCAIWAEGHINRPFEGGQRDLTDEFLQKDEMILLRTPPPLLETPFSVFDNGSSHPMTRFTCVGTWPIFRRRLTVLPSG